MLTPCSYACVLAPVFILELFAQLRVYGYGGVDLYCDPPCGIAPISHNLSSHDNRGHDQLYEDILLLKVMCGTPQQYHLVQRVETALVGARLA